MRYSCHGGEKETPTAKPKDYIRVKIEKIFRDYLEHSKNSASLAFTAFFGSNRYFNIEPIWL